MTGRKPTPTALKLLKGNPGKRPLPENEPDPRGEVKKPPFVKGYRPQKLWKQYAPELERLGVLKSTDVDMFGGWCCLMAEMQEAPQLFTAAKWSQLRALAASFGLEPSSRSRFSVPQPRKKDDAEEFFD